MGKPQLCCRALVSPKMVDATYICIHLFGHHNRAEISFGLLALSCFGRICGCQAIMKTLSAVSGVQSAQHGLKISSF